ATPPLKSIIFYSHFQRLSAFRRPMPVVEISLSAGVMGEFLKNPAIAPVHRIKSKRPIRPKSRVAATTLPFNDAIMPFCRAMCRGSILVTCWQTSRMRVFIDKLLGRPPVLTDLRAYESAVALIHDAGKHLKHKSDQALRTMAHALRREFPAANPDDMRFTAYALASEVSERT